MSEWIGVTRSSRPSLASPYDPLALSHTFSDPGTYNVFVSVSNGDGGYASQTIALSVGGGPNTAPTLTVDTTPTAGVAPLDVAVRMAAEDAERSPLTYKVDFGDGSTAVSGPYPPADLISHRYTKVGSYLLRATVSDGSLSTVRTSRIEVALAEPLAANAGDDTSVLVGTAVHLDGTASRPTAGIESYRHGSSTAAPPGSPSWTTPTTRLALTRRPSR